MNQRKAKYIRKMVGFVPSDVREYMEIPRKKNHKGEVTSTQLVAKGRRMEYQAAKKVR